MATNTVQKAISDTENEPSIWWVDFPDKQSVEKQDLLAITMNKVNEYRNWASLQWWQTVFGNDQRVPQDSSAPSATIRSSFCAEVASVHMKQTPWLNQQLDSPVSKDISCQAADFYSQLVLSAFEGFLEFDDQVVNRFQGFFNSICQSVATVDDSHPRKKLLVLQRYEYVPQSDSIVSYVRLISFTVTDDMKIIQSAVFSDEPVECTIKFDQYEASFNPRLWDEVAGDLTGDSKKAAETLRQMQTI